AAFPLGATGCGCGGPPLGGRRCICQSDSDCLSGYSCAGGECRKTGQASALVFVTPEQTLASGTCSLAVGLETRDTSSNAQAVKAETQIDLSAAGTSGFAFYADSACTQEISAVKVSAGASSASFFFKGTGS